MLIYNIICLLLFVYYAINLLSMFCVYYRHIVQIMNKFFLISNLTTCQNILHLIFGVGYSYVLCEIFFASDLWQQNPGPVFFVAHPYNVYVQSKLIALPCKICARSQHIGESHPRSHLSEIICADIRTMHAR